MKQNKRLSVSLSKEDMRKIESLADEFGESKASIVQQAVRQYYYQHLLCKMFDHQRIENKKVIIGRLHCEDDPNRRCDD